MAAVDFVLLMDAGQVFVTPIVGAVLCPVTCSGGCADSRCS